MLKKEDLRDGQPVQVKLTGKVTYVYPSFPRSRGKVVWTCTDPPSREGIVYPLSMLEKVLPKKPVLTKPDNRRKQ